MKRLTKFLAFLAVVGTVAVWWQHQSSAQLRQAGNSAATADSIIIESTNTPSSAASNGEVIALREQAGDLPRLRNEITQLRSRAAELESAQREHLQLTEAKRTGGSIPRESPPGFISKERLSNVGYETPENALQTMFWAMREGSYALAIQSFAPESGERIHFESLPPEKRAEEESAFKRDGPKRTMKNFNDFSVARREDISDDTVILHVRSSVGTNTSKFQLKRSGAEWKLVSF